MKYILFLTAFVLLISCQQKPLTQEQLNKELASQSLAMEEDLIALRRDLHQYPELAGEETRTAKTIAEHLKESGLEVHENIGGYGVVGILKTDKPGKHIAWRADIDALATDFEDPVAFKSVHDGVRHICGHDVHTTIGLGIARNLSQLKEQLAGTYYFVFQPAEENITGAKAMLDEDLMELINPDEFYAAHITPFPAGVIATKPKELYAHYKEVSLTLNTTDSEDIRFVSSKMNDLSNVSNPEFGTDASFEDPVTGIAGSNTMYQDYTLLETSIYPNSENDQTVLRGYYSFSDQNQLDTFKKNLQNMIDESPLDQVVIDHNIKPVSYVLQNDPDVTAQSVKILMNYYPESVVELSGVFPGGRSDDFALFLEKVPGTYFFLGGSNFEQNKISMPHAPIFEVDESVIQKAVERFSVLMTARAQTE
ncbi:M20 metallopeptidase family protein [Nonlabens ponticola]|uniref:Amidohydrolase n=1 Tax=Nonlabens ponticola TaxID=2496866 RepID=A0A3S9MZZ4_9FLAO|nr:M20 family metallopeptidase [Nonlabens ponticola]AZQ44811.1 amidohydrolase [Nonlabens ponticola]